MKVYRIVVKVECGIHDPVLGFILDEDSGEHHAGALITVEAGKEQRRWVDVFSSLGRAFHRAFGEKRKVEP